MRSVRIKDTSTTSKLCMLTAALACTLMVVGCGRAPHPEITRAWKGAPYEYCIGVYTGATPVNLVPRAGVPETPVFTGADITGVPARFVADPFVVRRDGTWYLFFELFNALTGQGDIGLATSRDGLQWRFVQTVLDEPFHLSYPFVFEWNHAWYMLPEGSASGMLTLYRAVDFPLTWTVDTKLLDGGYVDTTLLHFSGQWWMFTTPNGSKDLLLFVADNLRGPWKPHPSSPLQKNNGDIARCGGRMIVYDGVPLRYTQDDDPAYGNALRAFRIIALTATNYAEEPASAQPILNATGRGWRAWGMHQLDPVEVQPNHWQAMVDGVGPALPDTPLKVEFANGICLDGISVRPTRVNAGSYVLLRYFLSGIPTVFTNKLAVFVHIGPKGLETVFQGDFDLDPKREFYEQLVEVPSNAPAGRYEMRVGLYAPETGQSVALKGVGKQRDRCRIGRVMEVTERNN